MRERYRLDGPDPTGIRLPGRDELYGPTRWVPKATSSYTTLYVRPACTSPIWIRPTAVVPRLVVIESESMWTPSSHTSTTLEVPLTSVCISSSCQPLPGATTVELVKLN